MSKVMIELNEADLENLKQVLGFSANWLPQSKAPAIDVLTVVNAINQVLPQLVPVVDNKVQEATVPEKPAIVQ